MNRARRLGAGSSGARAATGSERHRPSIDWDRRRSQGCRRVRLVQRPSSGGRVHRDPPEPRTTHDIGPDDLHGKLHFLSKQPVQAPAGATAASNDDAVSTMSAANSGGGPLEAGTNRLDDCRHGLAKRLTNFVLGETIVFGMPSARSRPFTSTVRGSCSPGQAEPSVILSSSA